MKNIMEKELIKILCNSIILIAGTEDILPTLNELSKGNISQELIDKMKSFNIKQIESLKYRIANQHTMEIIAL
jgi:hypothetical protein